MHSDHPALFLDRDGVINKDLGHVYRIEDFHFLPHVLTSCRQFHEAGYKLVVVTNQAGLAKGYYTTHAFQILSNWMSNVFQEAGAPLSGIYYCPHHPEGSISEFKGVCMCRKPAPGLFLRAKKELRLDMPNSILVGDKDSDVLAARAAGVRTHYLIGPTDTQDSSSSLDPSVPYISSLLEITRLLA